MGAHGDAGRADAPWLPAPGTAAAEQAEMFGSIAMSSPAGVVVSDLDARIVWVNPVAERLFGWPCEELIGQPVTVLLPPGTHDDILALRVRILRGEHTEPFLARACRRDGEVFDVHATPGVRLDAEGRPLGTNMVLRDVTDELRVQRDLAEALARSRARFDQSATPQALLDTEGRFVEVNDAACAMLGWSREELVGRLSTEVIWPERPDEVRDRLHRLRDGRLRAATYETIGLRKDGSHVPLQIDITAVHDEQGRAYEFAAYASDLTDLREAQARLRTQEAFFRALSREASDITLVVDATGRFRYASPSVEQVLGYRPEQLTALDGEQALTHPEDLAGIADRRRRLREPGARERFAVRMRQADGAWHWFEATVANRFDDPDIDGVMINLRDIAAERAAEQALRESEARHRAIVQTAQEGIIAASPDGRVLFANERLTAILGLSLEQVYGLNGETTTGPLAGAPSLRHVLEHPPTDGPECHDVDHVDPSGRTRLLEVAASELRTDHGALLGTLAMVSDVTEQRSAEARLRHQALHDALTGLPNRVLFRDRLEMARARHERDGGRGLAVLFLDLDDFKRVNDSHGHETGDRLLVEVAGRVAGAVRASDTVARLGGDEFAVICEDVDAAAALQVAARIGKALEDPVEVDGVRVDSRASIGIALSPPYDVADLLRLADRAMYRAKTSPDRSVEVHGEPDGGR